MATLIVRSPVKTPDHAMIVRRVSGLYQELRELAATMATIEARLVRQEQWLDAHPWPHPDWGHRHSIYWSTCRRRERLQREIADIARQCDRLVKTLSAEQRRELDETVYAYASLGSAGVYAFVAAIAPFRGIFPVPGEGDEA